MSFGDYTTYQKWNTARIFNRVVLATDGTTELASFLSPKSTNHQLFIQKLTFTIKTAAAQAIVFQDTASTPVVIATVPASATLPQVFDFGPTGYPLTVGKNLSAVCTAGVAGTLHIEGYEKISSGAINTGTIASGQ